MGCVFDKDAPLEWRAPGKDAKGGIGQTGARALSPSASSRFLSAMRSSEA